MGGAPVSDDPRRASAPAPVTALEAAARALLAAASGAAQWGAGGRRAALSALDRVSGVLTAARSRVLTAEQDDGTWGVHGDKDFAEWVGRTSRQGRGAGFAQVGQAAALATMPVVERGLIDGPVTPGHLQQLTRATAASPLLAERLATPLGQEEVVRLAGKLDAGHFGKALARMGAAVDPASRQRSHDEQRANRFLRLQHTPGGTVVNGRLDSVAGNLFQRAVDALNPTPAADDDRHHDQRQADALTAMSQRVLADTTTTPGALVPPQVTLVIREQTWAALRAAGVGAASPAEAESPAGATGSCASAGDGGPDVMDVTGDPSGGGRRSAVGAGSAADVVSRLRGVPAVTDEDGNVWPASEMARVLCDDEITRLVMGTAGVAVAEGRGKRLFTAHQRKAIVAMDGGGCAYPGCAMPARYTDLHHLTWWDRDRGPTDVANGCQLCNFHHHEVHRRDVRITRNARGALVFTFPDGRVAVGGAKDEPLTCTDPAQPWSAEPPPPAVDDGGHNRSSRTQPSPLAANERLDRLLGAEPLTPPERREGAPEAELCPQREEAAEAGSSPRGEGLAEAELCPRGEAAETDETGLQPMLWSA